MGLGPRQINNGDGRKAREGCLLQKETSTSEDVDTCMLYMLVSKLLEVCIRILISPFGWMMGSEKMRPGGTFSLYPAGGYGKGPKGGDLSRGSGGVVKS